MKKYKGLPESHSSLLEFQVALLLFVPCMKQKRSVRHGEITFMCSDGKIFNKKFTRMNWSMCIYDGTEQWCTIPVIPIPESALILLESESESEILKGTGIRTGIRIREFGPGLESVSEWNQCISCWNRNRNQSFEFSWNWNQAVPGIVHHWYRKRHTNMGYRPMSRVFWVC